jgi:hypothetical protein
VVSCGASLISLQFASQEAFKSATTSWAWVNQKKEHFFVLVVNGPPCSATGHRAAYNVTSVTTDPAHLVANFVVQEVTIKESFHQGSWSVSMLGPRSPKSVGHKDNTQHDAELDKRDCGFLASCTDVRGSLASSFNGWTLFADDYASVTCTTCGTTGTVDVFAQISWDLLAMFELTNPITAFVRFSASDVSAFVNLKIQAGKTGANMWSDSGSITILEWLGWLIELPADYGKIGVLPQLDLGYSADLDVGGTFTVGVTGNMSQSTATLCIIGDCQTGKTG